MVRLISLVVTLMLPPAAHAWDDAQTGLPTSSGRSGLAALVAATHLIELQQGSRLSARARELGSGGFETASGNRVNFRPWYSSRWRNVSVAWLTQLSPGFGIIHGFSTGERGEKYEIAPALKLGLMLQHQSGKNAFITFRATTTLGGELSEKSCTADYGEIGGVQAVNCRLAATPLPPATTLDYLVREAPPDRLQAALTFHWQF